MATSFYYKNADLFGEEINLSSVADEFGTPCYVYSKKALDSNWEAFTDAFQESAYQICYAVKANSNLAILNGWAKKNAGFDIVSMGECERVLAAKGDPKKIVFSGVGKNANEIALALKAGVGCFNVESEFECYRLQDIAKKINIPANIALRVNPDIDPKTHPFIATGLSSNKFGIPQDDVVLLCEKIQSLSHLKLIGMACHIGSQLTQLDPFLEAMDRLFLIHENLNVKGISIKHINVGGGLGVRYQNEKPPSIKEYVQAIRDKFKKSGLEIIIEPGRALVANAGILISRIEYIKQSKHKNFAIIDAGMNDFLRPALYEAWHEILPLKKRKDGKEKYYDIVGPVCESADFLGINRLLELEADDLLAICCAGAYGFSMSSNYNSRPRAAEVMIDKNKVSLIRERESIRSLFQGEHLIV